jgi:hypothetical protein
MGNSLKPCTNPPTSKEVSLTTNEQPSTDIPEMVGFNELCPSRLNLDEINAHNKKWQEEKQEREKKDEIYKNVPLTKEFLQQNIKKESFIEFQAPVSKFLTKDIYGFDILKINLLEYGLYYKKYISSVKINFVSKDFDNDNETINVLLKNSCYNLTFDTYNLIFYGNFVQNQNLLLSNNLENYIVLPEYISKAYDNVDINILNVKKLFPILDNLEIKIMVTEIEFNEFAEGRVNYKYCFEQFYERNDETWNELNICNSSGCSCIGYSMNIPIKKEEIKEEIKEEQTEL